MLENVGSQASAGAGSRFVAGGGIALVATSLDVATTDSIGSAAQRVKRRPRHRGQAAEATVAA